MKYFDSLSRNIWSSLEDICDPEVFDFDNQKQLQDRICSRLSQMDYTSLSAIHLRTTKQNYANLAKAIKTISKHQFIFIISQQTQNLALFGKIAKIILKY